MKQLLPALITFSTMLCACGDDSSPTGGAAAGGAGGVGGTAGAEPVCDPTYVAGSGACLPGCIEIGGDQGDVLCTNACTKPEDCQTFTECAPSPTQESLCLQPCDDCQLTGAYCDTELYPGYCLPYGFE
mgnify:CR=1 FL=1